MAFTSFLIEKTPQELQKMDGTQLKRELASLLAEDTPLPTLEIDQASYDLSGNPESASLARNNLERALISTTASLFGFLLIEGENQAGKFFKDLDTNCRSIAFRVREVNTLYIILKEFLNFKWRRFSIRGSLPTLKELGEDKICRYVDKHPHDYLEKILAIFLKNLENEFKSPLILLIDQCRIQAENQKTDFNLEIELEVFQSEKAKTKVIQDLEKLRSRLKAGKKVSSKEFDSIKSNFLKEYEKLKQETTKEFTKFTKIVGDQLSKEPLWFDYHKKELQWELESPQQVLNKLNEKLSIENAFFSQKKSKTFQKAITIFDQLGGVRFALENIISHYFYERIPSRLIELLETPAKQQKIKELKFLQEKRYNEGLEAVESFLVPYSENMISSLLTAGISFLKESYIKDNPVVLINEENPRHPKFLNLVDVPKEWFYEKSPETFFGDEYFCFQMNDNQVKMGFHLRSLDGKGNDLFKLLISSTALENALIYKKATKILGTFSGYVYSTAIGNMRVCPPALKAVDDLFM
ncbi:MAG: hypothetical protein JSW11_00055 [Candidatus Heimdallarchaeota archaeon]|nr:MAG: hypothetical protein JSW11_00055 [Candidatus Heimdallarchaeota archaeon]